ncbi:MAG: hypothetical protein ACREMA_01760 [Longimicrobiales bacterium]
MRLRPAGIFVSHLLLFGFASAQQSGKLAPTEVLHLQLQEMLAHPQKAQAQNTQQFVDLARTSDTDRVELAALGEVYFLAFYPEAATDVFTGLMSGNDRFARLAYQRLIRMKFAAENKPEDAARLLAAFYQRFRPTPEDLSFGATGASDQVGHYRGKGDASRALAFSNGEFDRLPFDAPYTGLTLPARFFSLYQQAGQADQAIARTRKALDGLTALAGRRQITASTPSQRGLGLPHRPGTFHTFAEGLLADAPDFDRQKITDNATSIMIQQLRGMLANMEPPRTAVDSFRFAWRDAIRARDATALRPLMDDQLTQPRAGLPPLVGRDSVNASFARSFAGLSGPTSFSMYPAYSYSAGSWAVEHGTFGPAGVAPAGAYILVLKRTATGWRATSWASGADLNGIDTR